MIVYDISGRQQLGSQSDVNRHWVEVDASMRDGKRRLLLCLSVFKSNSHRYSRFFKDLSYYESFFGN